MTVKHTAQPAVQYLREAHTVARAFDARIPTGPRGHRMRYAAGEKLPLARAVLLHPAGRMVVHALLIHKHELVSGRSDTKLLESRGVAVRGKDFEGGPITSNGHTRVVAVASKAARLFTSPFENHLIGMCTVLPA